MIRLNGRLMRKKLDATLKSLEETGTAFEGHENEKNEKEGSNS